MFTIFSMRHKKTTKNIINTVAVLKDEYAIRHVENNWCGGIRDGSIICWVSNYISFASVESFGPLKEYLKLEEGSVFTFHQDMV